jgi:hypothetical protein
MDLRIMTKHQGGCHCGAVRWQVQIEKYQAIDCNCSMCRRKGFLHLILPPSHFELLQGEDSLTVYTFNTQIAQHLFCRHCGIHSFYRPRSHPTDFDVNVHCLDEDLIDRFQIEPFDGQNWEQNVDRIR